MKLGTRAKYTLRLMMGVGRMAEKKKPVPLTDVARHCGISRRYLEQLVVSLKHSDLLRGHSGRGGGYTLSRPANRIRVVEIIRAAIGPIAVSECVGKPGICLQSEFCQCRMLWCLINARITQVLSEYTLADLLDHTWPARIQDELAALNQTTNNATLSALEGSAPRTADGAEQRSCGQLVPAVET